MHYLQIALRYSAPSLFVGMMAYLTLQKISNWKESRFMLQTLRRIVQEVSTAPDLPSALAITVNRIQDTMRVAACTVYLADEDNRNHVLMATVGLNPQAVGQVRLNHGEGLVGLVAERQEPINLEDAPSHPRFHPVCEVCEEAYHAFLGVPLIQYRRVLGVLLVQDIAVRQFQPDEVDFLVTIAAQLASILNHAILSGATQELLNPLTTGARALRGVSGAPGVAMGSPCPICWLTLTMCRTVRPRMAPPRKRPFTPPSPPSNRNCARPATGWRRCCRPPNRRYSRSTG